MQLGASKEFLTNAKRFKDFILNNFS